jgi:hypothetical protein
MTDVFSSGATAFKTALIATNAAKNERSKIRITE